jgi:hypothetical protein
MSVDPQQLAAPTAALNVTLGRLTTEYFGVAEDMGVAIEGQPTSLFFMSLGRLVANFAKDMLSLPTHAKSAHEDLIQEYLGMIADGAYAKRDASVIQNLN